MLALLDFLKYVTDNWILLAARINTLSLIGKIIVNIMVFSSQLQSTQ